MTPDEGAVLDAITAQRLLPMATALVRAPGANPPGEEAATG